MSLAIDSSTIDLPPGIGFATRLRTCTASLHVRAERSGILADLLRGHASRARYALFLRNLWPCYRALEAGLDGHRAAPALAPFAQPALYRSLAMAADLAMLCGGDWAARLPLLPAAARYAHRIEQAARRDGSRLIAHAYVRTMGDLSGGQVVARRLMQTLQMPPEALHFYAFPDVPDLAAAKSGYRAALDAAGMLVPQPEAVLREAQIAFRLNIALSEAVRGCPGGDAAIC